MTKEEIQENVELENISQSYNHENIKHNQDLTIHLKFPIKKDVTPNLNKILEYLELLIFKMLIEMFNGTKTVGNKYYLLKLNMYIIYSHSIPPLSICLKRSILHNQTNDKWHTKTIIVAKKEKQKSAIICPQ